MADVIQLDTKRLAELTLHVASHPAVSMAAAGRVRRILADQPEISFTAATLVWALVDSACNGHGVETICLGVIPSDRNVRVTVKAHGPWGGQRWRVGWVAEVLLDEFSSGWGQLADSCGAWFELIPTIELSPAQGAA